jgi:hypothetical protein
MEVMGIGDGRELERHEILAPFSAIVGTDAGNCRIGAGGPS